MRDFNLVILKKLHEMKFYRYDIYVFINENFGFKNGINLNSNLKLRQCAKFQFERVIKCKIFLCKCEIEHHSN